MVAGVLFDGQRPAAATTGRLVPSHHPQPRLQHLAYRVHPGPQGRIDQVCVAMGGADLGVAEEAADHFQRCAAGDQQRSEGVPQVVDADVGDLGDLLMLG